MRFLLHLLFGVGLLGSITSTVYCGLVLVATLRFGARKRRDKRTAADFLPPLSVLKPLHGIEPGLDRNLATFFEQGYPDFELVFCARHETDEGLQAARRVAARYPGVQAHFVTCGEPPANFPNAKVYSLEKLDSVARHPLYLTSDADVRVEPNYLRSMVQKLADERCGLAFSVYLGTPYGGAEASFATKLDAVGKSVEMSSGVLVAEMVEGGTKFALGPAMVLRKTSFQQAGGFFELGQYHAEDFELGSRLAKQKIGVEIATPVIRLMVQDQPFWVSFRNQLRWMQSTRRSRPLGHLGSGLTFSVPFGLFGLLWGLCSHHSIAGVFWFLLMVANRWLQAGTVLAVLGDPDWLQNTLIYPLRDLLGSVLWLGSYGGNTFYYRGANYKLKQGGRVEAPE